MDLDLYGKYALVGGGSKGLGKASAIELALLGAEVTLVARDEEGLRAALDELPRPRGQQHGYLTLDYDRPGDIPGALAPLLARHTIHILVHNTGGPPGGPITAAGADAFLAAFTRHLLSGQALVQALLPGMKAAGYGRIINIISTSVKQPLPGLGVSNTIRGAVANWAKTLANETAAWGVTVNNVLPGATATDRLAQIIRDKAARLGQDEEAITREMTSEIPMGRFGQPREPAAAVAFLATPAAAYITGINLPVDGGRTGCL
jgi:3-oxoacyl-[acyl-carrier protein] reductase